MLKNKPFQIDRFLLGALLAGFVLRVTGIHWGMHYPDEHIVINHAMAFGTGDLNPHFFIYPTLLMYVLFIFYGIFYVLGHLVQFFPTADDFLRLYLLSPHIFYMLARMVSVLFGTATIWACYKLTAKYANSAAARIAAIFMAVCFLPVRDSHFVITDIPLTFFMTLALALTLKYLDSRRMQDLLWASALTGIAASIKYNAFFLALPIAAAYFMTEKPQISRVFRDALSCALLMVAAFFVGSPFVFLDFGSASKEILHQLEVNRAFHVGPWHHLSMVFYGLDIYLFFLFVLGFLLSLRNFDKKLAILISFLGAYYYLITKAGQPFERYVLPLLPVCILFAAVALQKAEAWIADPRQRKTFLIGLTAVVTSLSLVKTLSSDILFLHQDTRDLAAQWISAHVPPKSTVVLDNAMDCPRLTASKEQIEQKIKDLNAQSSQDRIKERRLKALAEIQPYPKDSYDLYYLGIETGQFTLLGPGVPFSVESLEVIHADYVVADTRAMARQMKFYEELKQRADQVALFDPRKNPERPMTSEHWTTIPIDGFFWNYKNPGPMIHIFKIRKSYAAAG